MMIDWIWDKYTISWHWNLSISNRIVKSLWILLLYLSWTLGKLLIW